MRILHFLEAFGVIDFNRDALGVDFRSLNFSCYHFPGVIFYLDYSSCFFFFFIYILFLTIAGAN